MLSGAPTDGAFSLLKEHSPGGDASREHVGVRVLRRAEALRVDDEEGRALARAGSLLDRARCRYAPCLVVVETERDGLDAERGEPLEELRARPRPSQSSNA